MSDEATVGGELVQPHIRLQCICTLVCMIVQSEAGLGTYDGITHSTDISLSTHISTRGFL